MPEFSANLGFLWSELPLADAIRAAASAGFHAVELHWPYETDPGLVRAALEETGLPLLGLNTRRGDVEKGENGLSALPERVPEARAAIDEALIYARETGAGAVHIMAGVASGDAAEKVFLDNIRYAAERGPDITWLIEPLNAYDAPGYFLQSVDQARDLLDRVPHPNVRMMFDCYHVGRTGGDVIALLHQMRPLIGHIQFASVPERGPPGQAEKPIFAAIDAMGWDKPLGAEYKPDGSTDASLSWLNSYGQA